jgi:hypothetical protein
LFGFARLLLLAASEIILGWKDGRNPRRNEPSPCHHETAKHAKQRQSVSSWGREPSACEKALLERRHVSVSSDTYQAFESMAAQMTAEEKLNPKIVTAARKNELCAAVGTTPAIYNRMAGMHQEARAAFKSW